VTATRERERVEQIAKDVEDLETIEDAVAHNQEASRALHRLRDSRLGELRGVRISVASAILGVSTPTLRRWADLGILEDVDEDPIRRVSLESVLRLRPLLHQLRRLGQRRNLLEAVLARFEDRGTLADRTLLESVEQMRRGELVDITPEG
jgi:DNA-binding transcriptional MerR regulator